MPASLTRRATLGLLPFVLVPTGLRAQTCPTALPGLGLCEAQGWQVVTTSEVVLQLAHAAGITGSIKLETGLDLDAELWANWHQAHAPIRARGTILTTELTSIDGRTAATTVWRHRRLDMSTVVAMTGLVGGGLAVSVITSTPAETYDDTHRDAHQRLCAALRLDQPE